ncbi:hypothetical protein VHEMI04426 [[Torrubiella] hemipterigena]|uniref:Secreted protein n=1 Tax=[Torrubiella] hemipterigena TaxID=1531966 RepID=A0A0A1TDS1_9HYPO|nr:hypothetical protein VHEMI04426 [[Torrubiella] hemipterigena]
MHFNLALTSTVATALTSCVAALPNAGKLVVGDAIEGYGVEKIQWEFDGPDGSKIHVNGTMEQVVHHMRINYPSHNIFHTQEEMKALHARGELAARTDFHGAPFNCNWPKCWDVGIIQGIQYLRGLKGRPSNGPGPGNCGRVSCSYDNAIWWCNDTKQTKTLQSFSSIADGAQFIESHCVSNNGALAGQVFHPTGWNVIVRSSKC